MSWDVVIVADSRFMLGLGTQIRPHIERHFGERWSKPNARMREFVRARRAIWRCRHTDRGWLDGGCRRLQPAPQPLSMADALRGRRRRWGGSETRPSATPQRLTGGRYLPVLTNWMQSPWFLKGRGEVKVRQPPCLHCSLLIGPAGVGVGVGTGLPSTVIAPSVALTPGTA